MYHNLAVFLRGQWLHCIQVDSVCSTPCPRSFPAKWHIWAFPPKTPHTYIVGDSFLSCPRGLQANPKTRTSSFNTVCWHVCSDTLLLNRDKKCVYGSVLPTDTLCSPLWKTWSCLTTVNWKKPTATEPAAIHIGTVKGRLVNAWKRSHVPLVYVAWILPSPWEAFGNLHTKACKSPDSSTSPQLEEESLVTHWRQREGAAALCPADEQRGGWGRSAALPWGQTAA